MNLRQLLSAQVSKFGDNFSDKTHCCSTWMLLQSGIRDDAIVGTTWNLYFGRQPIKIENLNRNRLIDGSVRGKNPSTPNHNITIVNMARYQNIVFASLLCVFDIFVIESKIFSKSVGEISLFQQPEVSIYKNGHFLRRKRSAKFEGANSTLTDNNFHSQNVTLNTTAFSLHGVNDNEVFVHWTGENNDVSIYIYLTVINYPFTINV